MLFYKCEAFSLRLSVEAMGGSNLCIHLGMSFGSMTKAAAHSGRLLELRIATKNDV